MVEKKFVSAVVYLHSDEKFAGEFFDKIISAIDEAFSQYEIVLVDDACEDGTLELLKKKISERGIKQMISVVHMGFYQGLEASMNAGRDVSIGDFVFEFDTVNADYEPSLIMDVYNRVSEGFDIVAASSKGKKKFTSKLFYSLFNKTNRGKVNITSESFRIISRRAINRVKSLGQFIPYRKAVYANCGLKTDRIFYTPTTNTRQTTSKSARTGLALDSFIYFTNALEKLSAIISAVFLVFTLVMGVYILVDHFIEKNIVEGWTSTMIFMSVGFFGIFALLTIIMKYMSVLLNLEFRKQRYLVADIEKLGD